MGIEWSVSAAMALERMRHDGRHLLSVLDGDLVIGRIHRRDLEDLSRCGAWLSSVLVRDAMRRAA
jgi:prophage tail gpP-like protein